MQRRIKVILVGETEVGKTSLITQYTEQKFTNAYIATYANDRVHKAITIDNETLNLEIWDTIGQEKMRALNKIFMKNADIALLIYDVTSQKTFNEIKYWHKVIEDANGKDNVVFGLVGNKSDLFEKQVVNLNEAKNLANELNIDCFETSAKDFSSINKVFERLCKLFYEKEKKKQKDLTISDTFNSIIFQSPSNSNIKSESNSNNHNNNIIENNDIQNQNNNEKNINENENNNNNNGNNTITLTAENKKKKKFRC